MLLDIVQQWQMCFNEVPAKLLSTSLPEQWSLPRGSKVQPVGVDHLTSERIQKATLNPITKKQQQKQQQKNGNFRFDSLNENRTVVNRFSDWSNILYSKRFDIFFF